MKFELKKDLTYKIVIWMGPIVLLPLLLLAFSLTLFAIFIGVFLISLSILNSVSYTITDDKLFIKCFILRKRQKISEFISIKKVNNIYSSYALATDTLQIKIYYPFAGRGIYKFI